ncbi:MAG: hypothetical protein ABIR52_01240 [Casimicrobiaceae bacterium]
MFPAPLFNLPPAVHGEVVSELLDRLVAMRWDMAKHLSDGADVPGDVMHTLREVDAQLVLSIAEVKTIATKAGVFAPAERI